MVRWNLLDWLNQHRVTRYALASAMGAKRLQTIYRICQGTQAVEFETLNAILDALNNKLEIPTQIQDLLKYEPVQ